MPGPAATISHMHTCPMYSGSTPHTGGPITGPGIPTVLIAGKPAAVMGDVCTCSGPPDAIVKGEATVLIGGKPAATLGSMTAHGGIITVGEPTVLLGTGGTGTTVIMPIEEIPFPKITLINRITGKNREAIANQEAIKKEATNNEGEPKIYGVEWIYDEERITTHGVFQEVTVKAQVLNIPEGESITFSIKRPIEDEDEQGNITEKEEDVIELTGTVKNKKVEVTWEIEKTLEEKEQSNTTK